MGRATWVAIAMISCGPTPPPPPLSAPLAAPRGSAEPWQRASGDVIDVVDRRVISWDRHANGLAETSAIDGAPIQTRAIAGLAKNGGLRLWRAVPGGYLAFWDSPAVIAERNGALALVWSAPAGDWSTEHAVIDGAAIFARTRASAGIVRLALVDGHEVWRAALPAGTDEVALDSDGQLIYAAWSEPAAARRVRALDPATGRTVWTYDFAARPAALAVSHGIVVAALGGELHVVDGATGQLRAEVALGHPEAYPALRIDRGQIYTAYDDAVRAFTLSSGQALWWAPVALDGGPRLAIAGDDVVVATAASTLVGLGRASGERHWEIGVGLHPNAVIATAAAVVALGSDGAAGFGLPVRVPSESARLRGRIVPGGCGALGDAIVTVGDTRAALDRAGAYRARITARGIVTVTATTAHPSSLAAPSTTTVRLDGRGDYRVADLTPGRCAQE